MGRNSLGGTGVVRGRLEGGRVARWSRRPFSDPSRLGEHHGNGNEEESQTADVSQVLGAASTASLEVQKA